MLNENKATLMKAIMTFEKNTQRSVTIFYQNKKCTIMTYSNYTDPSVKNKEEIPPTPPFDGYNNGVDREAENADDINKKRPTSLTTNGHAMTENQTKKEKS